MPHRALLAAVAAALLAGCAEQAPGPALRRAQVTVILADGALPLDVLEAKVDRWIASQPGG